MSVLYEGKVIDMLDAESLCAVARFCDTHGTSWEQVEEGDSAETIEIVKQQCANCPSGRLTAVTKDGKRIEPELGDSAELFGSIAGDVFELALEMPLADVQFVRQLLYGQHPVCPDDQIGSPDDLRVYRLESRQTGDKMSIYYMYAFL